jgi:hypothetical protein
MSHGQPREYPLPFRCDGLYSVPDLDPWLARFAGRSAIEVSEILQREWDAITAHSVAAFRDAIVPFRPTSLYFEPPSPYFEASEDWCAGWWLRMVRPETNDQWEKELLVHAPPDRTVLLECLAAACPSRMSCSSSTGISPTCGLLRATHRPFMVRLFVDLTNSMFMSRLTRITRTFTESGPTPIISSATVREMRSS